jgi:hypothetical protein
MVTRRRTRVIASWITAVVGLVALVSSVGMAQGRVRGLREQVRALVALMAPAGPAIPAADLARLDRAAKLGDKGQVDSLLARRALLEIRINPESRVKVLRGAAKPELQAGKEARFLVRVVNEAGVTAPLRLYSANLGQGAPNRTRWLTATVFTRRGSEHALLSGAPLEYVILSLKTEAIGFREATLAFDVGQGTQDLGFRGETSILFRCRR